jgi:Family of unknown function (DUF6525)
MSITNSQGNFETTVEEDMGFFDRCPPILRRAQAYAVGSWSARHILMAFTRLVRSEGLPSQAAIGRIIRGMQDSDALDTVTFYGPAHPEALTATKRAHA